MKRWCFFFIPSGGRLHIIVDDWWVYFEVGGRKTPTIRVFVEHELLSSLQKSAGSSFYCVAGLFWNVLHDQSPNMCMGGGGGVTLMSLRCMPLLHACMKWFMSMLYILTYTYIDTSFFVMFMCIYVSFNIVCSCCHNRITCMIYW